MAAGDDGVGRSERKEQQLIWLDVTVRDVLARYEVGETVGVGGFAVVKKGRDKKTGEIVAIKVVDKWRYATEENSEREIRILSKVHHINCIQLHAVYVTARRVYIITELVTGGELLDKVTERGIFSEPEAAHLVRQVLAGVAYLHAKGIVHRDLKLENILLADRVALPAVAPPSPCAPPSPGAPAPGNPNSRSATSAGAGAPVAVGRVPGAVWMVKIADFGLSKVFSSGATLSTVCGSPLYMAPELLTLEGGTDYSPAVDVWSVGVILFILLAGYSPFDDVNDAALFEKIKSGKYDDGDPIWESISGGAKDLISKMLTVDVTKRLRAVECLDHPWLQEQAALMDRAVAEGRAAAALVQVPSPGQRRAVAARSRQQGSVSRMLSARSVLREAVQGSVDERLRVAEGLPEESLTAEAAAATPAAAASTSTAAPSLAVPAASVAADAAKVAGFRGKAAGAQGLRAGYEHGGAVDDCPDVASFL